MFSYHHIELYHFSALPLSISQAFEGKSCLTNLKLRKYVIFLLFIILVLVLYLIASKDQRITQKYNTIRGFSFFFLNIKLVLL